MNTPKPLYCHSFGKINLALRVRRKREDGYHEIDSIMASISAGDEIEFHAEPDGNECRIECSHPDVPEGPENLIAKAWALLRERHPDKVGGLRVKLNKIIPPGSGLGGGSSNAAAALSAVNRLYKLGLKTEALVRLAAELGSDVPFFIRGGIARVTGRGEIVERLKAASSGRVLGMLVYPGFPSPTAEAYAKLEPKDMIDKPLPVESIVAALSGGRLESIIAVQENAFDKALERSDRRYKSVKRDMKEAFLSGCRVSGSGSACFGWITALGQDLAEFENAALGAGIAMLKLSGKYPWAEAFVLGREGARFSSRPFETRSQERREETDSGPPRRSPRRASGR